ncbi:hypothetical protein PHYSODRAFT_387604, partial [Phytophthora sojae]
DVSSESEEPDESNDEDWSTAESAEKDGEVTGDSEGIEDGEQAEEDISINLIEVDVHQKVTGLIRADKCERRCLQGKAQELQSLVCSVSQMTKSERMTFVYSMLGVLMQTDTVERRRGKGEREKFNYYLPFVGAVCRPSFARCLDLTPLTIQRYKSRVRDGSIAAKAHGNVLNKNASSVDIPWLIKWFKEFAEEVGEVVPVRVRMQKTVAGKTKKYYSREDYTLLPVYFTWDSVYGEMHAYVEQIRLRVSEPGRSTMGKLLAQHCPEIRIRS